MTGTRDLIIGLNWIRTSFYLIVFGLDFTYGTCCAVSFSKGFFCAHVVPVAEFYLYSAVKTFEIGVHLTLELIYFGIDWMLLWKPYPFWNSIHMMYLVQVNDSPGCDVQNLFTPNLKFFSHNFPKSPPQILTNSDHFGFTSHMFAKNIMHVFE